MNARGWIMFKVLVNKYHPKEINAFNKFLSQNELEFLDKLDVQSSDLKPVVQHPETSLAKIHYSWIQPLLEKFPEPLRPLLVATLTPEQITGMRITKETATSSPVKYFLLNHLHHLLKINERTPFEYLPETEFSPLVVATKNQLVNLIDFLGIHDLAAEIKHIVNRNTLTNIYSCLTQKQLFYLKICLQQKQQIISPKLGIDPSKQDCDALKQTLHRRGLLRLAKALCGQHGDFVWYLAHILDKGRGNILLKEYQPQPIPKITPILKQQVLYLLNFLKPESHEK